MGEESKIAVRNIRREANENIKKLEKDKAISQDQEHDAQDDIQTETDHHAKKVDEVIQAKEEDLMTV